MSFRLLFHGSETYSGKVFGLHGLMCSKTEESSPERIWLVSKLFLRTCKQLFTIMINIAGFCLSVFFNNFDLSSYHQGINKIPYQLLGWNTYKEIYAAVQYQMIALLDQ